MKSLCSSKKVFSTAFCSITKFGLGLLGDWLDELAASSVIINILDNFANQSLKSVRCCHTKDHLQSSHNYLEKKTIFTSPVWLYFGTISLVSVANFVKLQFFNRDSNLIFALEKLVVQNFN